MDRLNTWALRNPWIFDFVRGVISLLFGLALWFYFDQALTIGVLALASICWPMVSSTSPPGIRRARWASVAGRGYCWGCSASSSPLPSSR